MADFNFGHIKRICESDQGHGMSKAALIHWVLGSIAEVERLETEVASEGSDADSYFDKAKRARAEGMEVVAAIVWTHRVRAETALRHAKLVPLSCSELGKIVYELELIEDDFSAATETGEAGSKELLSPASPSPGSASPVIIPECHKSVVMGQARHMLDPTSPDGGDAEETI